MFKYKQSSTTLSFLGCENGYLAKIHTRVIKPRNSSLQVGFEG